MRRLIGRRSYRASSGGEVMPQAAGPETVIRRSSSWPTRTELAETRASRLNGPMPPRNEAGRPAAGTGSISTRTGWVRADRFSSAATGIDGMWSVPECRATRRNRVRNWFSSPTMEPMPDRLIGLASVAMSHADTFGIDGRSIVGRWRLPTVLTRSSIPWPTKYGPRPISAWTRRGSSSSEARVLGAEKTNVRMRRRTFRGFRCALADASG